MLREIICNIACILGCLLSAIGFYSLAIIIIIANHKAFLENEINQFKDLSKITLKIPVKPFKQGMALVIIGMVLVAVSILPFV